jgi:hypothetical protein
MRQYQFLLWLFHRGFAQTVGYQKNPDITQRPPRLGDFLRVIRILNDAGEQWRRDICASD